MRVIHTKISAASDTADPDLIQPSDWNADHDLEGFVADDDPRLTDARTPTAHEHDYSAAIADHETTEPHIAADHSHSSYAGTAHNHDTAYSGTAHTHPGGSEAFPVGSVFLSVVSTNPSTLLGYGTWVAFGAGRMLIGNDGSTFGTDEATGGTSTHSHAAHSGVINHTHTVNVSDSGHAHAMQRFPTATGGSTGFTVDTSMSGTPAAANNTASATTGITASTANPSGGVTELTHDSVSHLPPYIVVHMWKRTA